MKFGGAATKSPESFATIAQIISQKILYFPRIAVVVSAMGRMTDELISLAYKVHPLPPKREYDMLVSVGERVSIALLAMALSKIGREAVSFTGSQSGILTTSEHTDAKIISVRPTRLIETMDLGKIAIVAGFQGVSEQKEITTLGRGGSDTSAVALGLALHAEKVEFYKDVAGIYQEDPKKTLKATLHPQLTYEKAYEIVTSSGGKVLHPRALRLAQKNGLPLHVRSFLNLHEMGTLIGVDRPRTMQPIYEEFEPQTTPA